MRKYVSSCSSTKGVSETPAFKLEWHQGNSFSFDEFRRGTSPTGRGLQQINSASLNWSRSTDKTAWWGGTSTTGDDVWKAAPTLKRDLSWGYGPSDQPDATFWGTLWEDFTRDPATQWVVANSGDLLQIAKGIDLVLAGIATLPFGGAGLIVLGADDLLTGVWNLASDVRLPSSLLSFGGYSAARGIGIGEGGAQTVGQWTPITLSIVGPGFGGFFGRFLGRFTGRGSSSTTTIRLTIGGAVRSGSQERTARAGISRLAENLLEAFR